MEFAGIYQEFGGIPAGEVFVFYSDPLFFTKLFAARLPASVNMESMIIVSTVLSLLAFGALTAVDKSIAAGGYGGSTSPVDGSLGTNRLVNPASVLDHPEWGVLFIDQFVAYRRAQSGVIFPYRRSVIRELATDGTVTSIVGTHLGGDLYPRDGFGTNAVLIAAQALVVNPANGRTFFTDFGSVRELSDRTNVTLFCGSYRDAYELPPTGQRTNIHIPMHSSIAFNHNGEMLIAGGPFIRKVSADGLVSVLYGKYPALRSDGPATNREVNATSILVAPSGELVFTTESAVKKITMAGEIVTLSTNLEGSLSIVNLFGREAFLERNSGRLLVLHGNLLQVIATGFDDPYSMSVSQEGALFICQNVGVIRVDLLGLGLDLKPFVTTEKLKVQGSDDLLTWRNDFFVASPERGFYRAVPREQDN